ncbi:uncharacterized protein LOC112201478 isoform X2 [Rosa chinensis]|nr:uncharacterized protein LOC112201478 isoform X2 [Rosa chinensis]
MPAAEITDSDPQNDAVLDDATPLRSITSVSRSLVLPWASDCEDQVKEGIVRFSTDGGSGKKKKRRRFWLKKKGVVNNVTKNLGDDSILKALREYEVNIGTSLLFYLQKALGCQTTTKFQLDYFSDSSSLKDHKPSFDDVQPRRPFEKEHLDVELKLVEEYGLRRKRDLWRVQYALSHICNAARELLTLDKKNPRRIFRPSCGYVLFCLMCLWEVVLIGKSVGVVL